MSKYKNLFGEVLRMCFVAVCMINFIASSFGWIAVIMQYDEKLDWHIELFLRFACILWTGLSISLLLYAINRFSLINFFRLIIFPIALTFSLVTATGWPADGLFYVIIVFPLIIVMWNFLFSYLLHHINRRSN
jgi:hypothetical protein